MKAAALETMALAIVAGLLLWPALYNGYPLLYPDSPIYVALSFAPQDYPPRSLPYPLLMYVLHLGYSLWGVILVQALIVAWVLRETIAALVGRLTWLWLLVVGSILSVLSGLAWTVDQIMPDVLTGAIALVLAVTLVFPQRLSLPRRLALLAIAAVGVALHPSHAPLAFGIVGIGAIVLRTLRLPLRRVLPPLAATASGIALAVAVHVIVTGSAYYAQGGAQFFFGRLVNDGIVADYLRQVCPRGDLSLCALEDELPTTNESYLWREQKAFDALGGWEPKPELRTIVVESMQRMPLRHLTAAVEGLSVQLVSIGLGESLFRRGVMAAEIIETAFPNEAFAFHHAKQQQDTLKPAIELFDRLQYPAQILALCLLPLLAGWLVWRGRRDMAGFCLVVLAALIVNAAVCGIFSGTAHRYQNRIAWIAVATVIVAAGAMRQANTGEKAS